VENGISLKWKGILKEEFSLKKLFPIILILLGMGVSILGIWNFSHRPVV